jgi:hypothetical protein
MNIQNNDKFNGTPSSLDNLYLLYFRSLPVEEKLQYYSEIATPKED